MTPPRTLLSTSGLSVEFTSDSGQRRMLLSGVDLTIGSGETIGVVGESGSSKSLMAKAIMRLLPPDVAATGTIAHSDRPDLLSISERQMARLRATRIALIYQDPFPTLNR